ncbi:MAG: glycosyl hydrolase family 18 protein [Chitinophagaceae bacterium]
MTCTFLKNCVAAFAILLITASDSFSQNKIRVLSYYYGEPAQLDSFNVNQMTHLIFCFGRLDGNRLKIRTARDTAVIRKMISLKTKNPQLKVILSLGGWGGCETCSDVFASRNGRKEFAQSVKELHEYFGTDGLDLDWEYPAVSGFPGHKFTPDDKKHFTSLVKQLRKLGAQYELSFAAGGSKRYLDSAIEWRKVIKKVDYVNLMSYDLVGAGSQETGHHTGLYSPHGQERSADFALQYLTKLGVPREKMIIGGAFYGKIFENVDSVNNGLYRPGKFKTSVFYKNVPLQVPADSGFVYHWDDVAKAPFMYNSARKLFFTYDDKRSIELKTKYVIDHKMGGIMFWHLGEDTFTGGLLETIDEVKRTYVSGLK